MSELMRKAGCMKPYVGHLAMEFGMRGLLYLRDGLWGIPRRCQGNCGGVGYVSLATTGAFSGTETSKKQTHADF